MSNSDVILANAIKDWNDREDKAPAVAAAFFDKKMIALLLLVGMIVVVAIVVCLIAHYRGNLLTSFTAEMIEIPVDTEGNPIDPSRIARS